MVLIAQPEFQARMELLAECQAMMLRESLLRTCRLLELRSPEKTETWQLISRWLVNLAPPLRERIWIGANALMEEMGECSWLASGKKGKKGNGR